MPNLQTIGIQALGIYSMQIQGGPKESLWIELEESVWEIQKNFDGVFLSIYSHLLKKIELSKFCRKKSYVALKFPKMACSKLV